jgi:hypothetical protein
MYFNPRLIAFVLSAVAISAGFGPAEAAPQQLFNKTITASFNYGATWRAPGGQTSDKQYSFSFVGYISSAGRIFERWTRGGGSQDFDPNASHNKAGEAHNTHFEGNRLVQVTAYVAGATRVIISFDPAFSSCTVEVITGKDSSGTVKRKAPNGIVYEMISHSVSGNSCSVRDGNSFAN